LIFKQLTIFPAKFTDRMVLIWFQNRLTDMPGQKTAANKEVQRTVYENGFSLKRLTTPYNINNSFYYVRTDIPLSTIICGYRLIFYDNLFRKNKNCFISAILFTIYFSPECLIPSLINRSRINKCRYL